MNENDILVIVADHLIVDLMHDGTESGLVLVEGFVGPFRLTILGSLNFNS